MSKLTILSKEQDVVGTDKYRVNDPLIPMAFRANAQMTVNPNADGTNHQVTVMIAKPVVVTDSNGIVSAPATFRMTTKFNAIQDRVNNTERLAAIDAHIEFLTKNKQAIADGILPTAPAVFTVDL